MTTRRKVALILTIAFVFVMLFSQVFVIAEADHDCSGEDCPVCETVAVIGNFFKELSIIGCLAFACAATVFAVIRSLFTRNETRSVFSLITLKVKLSS